MPTYGKVYIRREPYAILSIHVPSALAPQGTTHTLYVQTSPKLAESFNLYISVHEDRVEEIIRILGFEA